MDAFPATFLNAILGYMIRSSNSQPFLESIPRTGVEGTVKNFLTDPSITACVRAKSGSMTGVQTYAGYIHKPDNIYSFCIIINHYNGSRAQLRKTIETWLLPILK
jgi:D-alanyl-D-alanine carboxypeptidase/D-alanyl-D-alanine-endopeptidase (penicillin-binding protein 4)